MPHTNTFTLIYPGQHPFLQAVVIIIMAVLTCVSLLWLVLWYRYGQANRHVGSVFVLIAAAILTWMTYTYLDYREACRVQERSIPGRYTAIDGKGALRLKVDYTWTSDHVKLGCSGGQWRYFTSEDGEFIQLRCPNGPGMQIDHYTDTLLPVRALTGTNPIIFFRKETGPIL